MTQQTFHDRVARFQRFFGRNDPGDLLFVCSYLPPDFAIDGLETGLDLARFPDDPAGYGHDKVRECRAGSAARLAVGDDSVPFVNVGVNIGVMTAIFSGGRPTFDGGTSWAEPVLHDYNDIGRLQLDLTNPWIERVIEANAAVLEMYDDDFCLMPLVFRSPLDLANGIRGDEIYMEVYDHPDQLAQLVNWCAEAIIAVHAHVLSKVPAPPDRCGMWRSWWPDGIVFMNCDPVDLMSTELAEQFDRPYAGRVMQSAPGGGAYHHHGNGSHQIDYVSRLPGLTLQQIVSDPSEPDLMLRMTEDSAFADTVIEASLRAPFHWKFPNGASLLESLDVLKRGRFIFDLTPASDLALCRELAQRVRAVSGLS